MNGIGASGGGVRLSIAVAGPRDAGTIVFPIGKIALDPGQFQSNIPVREYMLTVSEMTNESSRSGIGEPSPPDLMRIAQAAREARRRHGLTQADLAGLAGTGVRFISELERGKPSLALNKVIDVLAALGLRLQVTGERP